MDPRPNLAHLQVIHDGFGILKQEQAKFDDIDPLGREAQLRLNKGNRS